MSTTLLVGPGVKRAFALEQALSAQGEVLVQESPHLLYADRLREKQVTTLVYLPDPKGWQGMRSEAHAVGALLDACEQAGVLTFLLLSGHRGYGASSQHDFLLPESTPLAASSQDPALRALIDVDAACVERMRRGGPLRVIVLRPVYILGKGLPSFMEDYLSTEFVPSCFGFDPLVQVVHVRDVLRAILLSLSRADAGIYHVAGSGAVPLSTLARERKVRRVPLLGVLGQKLNELAHRIGRSAVANGELPFLMYVLSVSDQKLRDAVGYRALVPLPDTLRDTLQQTHAPSVPSASAAPMERALLH